MKIKTIASGSSGNCTFISSDKTHIIVDVGISMKRIIEGLSDQELSLDRIDGIFITHEHIDHIKSLGAISRRYGIKIFATRETFNQFINPRYKKSLGYIDEELYNIIEPDNKYYIGDMIFEPHSIWHDAADPVCYSFYANNKKISIATDLGAYDDYIVNKLSDSDVILLEANHDIRMLQVGPYPYNVKMRILGNRGHLSNETSGKLLSRLMSDKVQKIILGHLSKENNYDELAYETVKSELCNNCFGFEVNECNLLVARPDVPGELIYIL